MCLNNGVRRTHDTAASAAAVNQLSGVSIVPEQWGEANARHGGECRRAYLIGGLVRWGKTTALPIRRDLSFLQLAERNAFIMTAVFILIFRVIFGLYIR